MPMAVEVRDIIIPVAAALTRGISIEYLAISFTHNFSTYILTSIQMV
jgi:hypothetical protein